MEDPRISQYHKEAQTLHRMGKEFEKQIDTWKELEQKVPEENLRYLFKKEFAETRLELKEGKKPSEILEEASKKYKRESKSLRAGHIAFKKRRQDLEKMYDNVDTIDKIGVERSADD